MAAGQVGTKKSLFKKPAWASSTIASNAEDDTPIFGQAHLYQEIVRAEKERREKQAVKQKEKAEREIQTAGERESKRRRISKEAEDSDEDSDRGARGSGSASTGSQPSQTNDVYITEERGENLSNTLKTAKTGPVDQLGTSHTPQTRSQKNKPNAQKAAVVLDDDDDDDNDDDNDDDIVIINPRDKEPSNLAQSKPPRPRSNPKRLASEPESSEEDDYLRELKAKARREARNKTSNNTIGQEETPGPLAGQHSPTGESVVIHDPASPYRHTATQTTRAASTPAAEDEPEVKIWIKSIIPNAKEVIVSRKVNQPLDKVKDFWIKRSELDPALAPKIFFTWNGTRLYNSTTMRGIIERLKKTNPTHDGGDPSNGRIVIEAVTEEIFEHRQQQRAARLAEPDATSPPSLSGYVNVGSSHGQRMDSDAAGNPDRHDDNDNATLVPQPATNNNKPGIVIKLKAQGLEDMSLRVRPHTSVRKILAGFRTVRNVDAGVQSWLSYDGDRLDEDATVEEVGFEHEDTVDVYLR